MGVSPLRGRIVAMFGTIGKFAEAIGWSRRKVSDIVNKKQEATASDIEKMAGLLQIELPEDFRVLFLT
jgi:plasmid maintenance system antidote protein VapI